MYVKAHRAMVNWHDVNVLIISEKCKITYGEGVGVNVKCNTKV